MSRTLHALILSSQERPIGPPLVAESQPVAGFRALTYWCGRCRAEHSWDHPHNTNDEEPATMRHPQVCDAALPICPKCNRPLMRRGALRPGSLLVTCDNRHPDPSRRGDHCGAHVFILGAPEGVCIVLLVSRDEFDRLAALGHQLQAREFYREVGILPTRPHTP